MFEREYIQSCTYILITRASATIQHKDNIVSLPRATVNGNRILFTTLHLVTLFVYQWYKQNKTILTLTLFSFSFFFLSFLFSWFSRFSLSFRSDVELREFSDLRRGFSWDSFWHFVLISPCWHKTHWN